MTSFKTARSNINNLRTSVSNKQIESALEHLTQLEATIESLEAASNRERELLLTVLKATHASADAAEQKKIDVFMKRRTADENDGIQKKKLSSPKPIPTVPTKAPSLGATARGSAFGKGGVLGPPRPLGLSGLTRDKSLDRTAARPRISGIK